MDIIDTHCDTACLIADNGADIADGRMAFSLKRLKKENTYAQFFACFISPHYRGAAEKRCIELIDTVKTTAMHNGMCVCTNISELYSARRRKMTAAFISIEGGECISSLKMLRTYRELGVRLAALTWNDTNHIAGGAHDERAGLTEFGRTVIAEMDRTGMTVDVSHLNERSFWDVIGCARTPVAASHSCARALCDNVRNLTDEQFCAIRDAGGYVGVNFYPPFLRKDCENASVNDVVEHIMHFVALGGEDTVGLGSDFDGTDGLMPSGLSDVGDLDGIADGLKHAGLDDKQVKKIMGGNASRMIKRFG